MRGVDEHPHAVDADEGDEGEAEAAHHEAGVADGHGQGQNAHADVALQAEQTSFFLSVTVAFSDSRSTLYVVHGRAKQFLCGPNSTESNLFHHVQVWMNV